MSSTSNPPRKARLPRLVTKYDLKTYFRCSYRVLWSRVLPDDLLEAWGYSYTELKAHRTLPPLLTEKIYRYYGITDLDAGPEPAEAPDEGGSRAPTDDI